MIESKVLLGFVVGAVVGGSAVGAYHSHADAPKVTPLQAATAPASDPNALAPLPGHPIGQVVCARNCAQGDASLRDFVAYDASAWILNQVVNGFAIFVCDPRYGAMADKRVVVLSKSLGRLSKGELLVTCGKVATQEPGEMDPTYFVDRLKFLGTNMIPLQDGFETRAYAFEAVY